MDMNTQLEFREITDKELAGTAFFLVSCFGFLRFFSQDQSIPEYFISLMILALGLLAYPLFFRGRVNFLMRDRRLWSFSSYALAVCLLAITASLLYRIFHT